MFGETTAIPFGDGLSIHTLPHLGSPVSTEDRGEYFFFLFIFVILFIEVINARVGYTGTSICCFGGVVFLVVGYVTGQGAVPGTGMGG